MKQNDANARELNLLLADEFDLASVNIAQIVWNLKTSNEMPQKHTTATIGWSKKRTNFTKDIMQEMGTFE